MWRVIVLAGLLWACGDNKTPQAKDDAGVTPDAAVDAAPDAPPVKVGPCIDRPTDLDRPPNGALPCELLPPGFVQP